MRQLWPDRVVAIAVDGIRPATRAGTLVSFDPSKPEEAAELGKASSWFPAHDGVGVWRVNQVAGGFPGAATDVAYEVELRALDGRVLSDARHLAIGDVPVAAVADGLAVQRPVPSGRAYPCDLRGQAVTAIGGSVYDVVAIDAQGRVVRRISDYTTVGRAGVEGLVLVLNSDPNVKVRPREVLDLDTGQPIGAAPAELGLVAYAQPRTSSDPANGTTSASMSGTQVLEIDRLGSDRAVATAALPNADTFDRRLAFNVQQTLQREALLVFPEVTETGVRFVAWDMSRGKVLARSSATFPPGSVPIGVVP